MSNSQKIQFSCQINKTTPMIDAFDDDGAFEEELNYIFAGYVPDQSEQTH